MKYTNYKVMAAPPPARSDRGRRGAGRHEHTILGAVLLCIGCLRGQPRNKITYCEKKEEIK